MDKLSDLAFFTLLARKGSLTAAAMELGITPPAVSKRLAALERRLGARLINRTTRTMTLTGEGTLYLESAAWILAEVDEVEQKIALSRTVPHGLLRINASIGFGRARVAPIISAFVRRYPDLEVQLQLTDRPVSLADEAYDLAIRIGEVPDSRLVARKIAGNRRILCAAPSYLQRAGIPRDPQQLRRHRCIVIRQDNAEYGLWRFFNGEEWETVRIKGALSCNDGEAALLWALEGQGILMRSEWSAAPHLRQGELVELLPGYRLPQADVHAIYPKGHHLSAKIRLFIEFLTARIDAEREVP